MRRSSVASLLPRPAAGRSTTVAATVAATVALSCAAALGSMAPAAAVVAQRAAVPAGLAVSLDDGVQQVRPGADVTYSARLTNSGAEAVRVRLVVSVPAFVSLRRGAGAEPAGKGMSWPLTVAPGRAVVKQVSAHIGTIPKNTYRVTSLVSVYQNTGERGAARRATEVPLIRAADANTIAGVADPAETAVPRGAGNAGRPATRGAGLGAGGIGLVCGAAVVVLAAAGVAWTRLRLRRSRSTTV